MIGSGGGAEDKKGGQDVLRHSPFTVDYVYVIKDPISTTLLVSAQSQAQKEECVIKIPHIDSSICSNDLPVLVTEYLKFFHVCARVFV